MVFNSYISGISPAMYEENFLWDKLFFASQIVDATFDYFQIERIRSKFGCPPWDLRNMMKLLHLSAVQKINDSKIIADNAKHHSIYIVLCGGITPKDRTIRDYQEIYSKIKQLILSFTLIVSRKLHISSFNDLTVDGTIKLSCNSPFNIIKRKDIHLLIKHYMVEELSKEELKNLRRSAKKFLNNKKINDEDKIEILFEWYDKLELTGQTSIPLYDVDARLMKVKDKGQKYKKWAYNIQVCTDTESKLICAINVVQYPTDHYQIPALLNQTIENLQLTPEIIIADNIYGTLGNLFYLKEHNISARIPTPRQSREILGIETKKYHKDHFTYDEKRDVIICPEKQILSRKSTSKAKVQKGGFQKTKIQYYNKEACKNCPNKSECSKSNYRIIVREVHELSTEVEKIMDTKQGRKDYKKRMSTAESHNGTFGRIYNYNALQTRGLKRVQSLMFGIAAAYNTIRIFNIAMNNHWDFNELITFIRLVGLHQDEKIVG